MVKAKRETPAGKSGGNAIASAERLLLATDLDGTFLAGEAEARLRLYRLIARHPGITLVYVTGRGYETVLPLLSDPTLPEPDYVICDVGATVVHGASQQPVQPLQSDITARWPGEQAVAEAIQDIPGLKRQDVPQERRCSYFCEQDAISDELHARVRGLGCELLYSADRYLDVLPPGVNKGSTLSALARHLDIDPATIMVAGDTLNDLSMYQHPFRGVCVGQSEPALLAATRYNDQVLHATQPGCGGILEAIAHFGLLGDASLRFGDRRHAATGQSDLVMVYHRLPYDEVVERGAIKRRRPSSPNGIIPTLLSFFGDGGEGAWVAWSVHDPELGPFEMRTAVDAERYPGLTAARVALSKEEVDIYCKRFSKEAFWPLLHTFWERARFREDHWQVFQEVNRRFAHCVAAEAALGATVWIHDYNLWLVPATLRELRPDLNIAFFHHTHFPSADVFNVVPWRRQIVASLLQCDYIGFHVPRQVENFVDVVRGALPLEVLSQRGCSPRFLSYGCGVGLDRMTTAIAAGGRTVRLGAHPVGLDVGRIEKALATDLVGRKRSELRAHYDQRRLILSVERLDYTKGTLQKLLAFERLLGRHPELVLAVALVVICVPAAREMTVYRKLQIDIEQAVGRINGRYAEVGWTPIHFFFRALPFDELVAWYAEADVAWITPLRDGLNLVAKEYVATKGVDGGEGVLVLSEFAGAAAELKGALLTNPHDPEDLVAVLAQALAMDREEARGRLRQLFDIVSHHDVARWGRDFLAAARGERLAQRKTTTRASVKAASANAPTRTAPGSPALRSAIDGRA